MSGMSGPPADVSDSQPPATPPWLVARGIRKTYGGVHALRGVDLDVSINQVYGIIGPNGAGKSTLMKVLTGAVSPDGGDIMVDGNLADIGSPALALRLGFVLMPQELTLVPEFSIIDNIGLGNEAIRSGGLRAPSESRARARAVMERAGLDADPTALARTLSPVQQRLLMLAKALNRNTRLLILDEPTAGLPAHEARQVTETIRRLRDHDLTVFFVSHHLSEVASLSDHVVCVREGLITTRLSGSEISKSALIDAMLGTPASEGSEHSETRLTRQPEPNDSDRGLALESVFGRRLHDVSFTARRGQVTGVTGLLGSGISELIEVLSGVSRPAAGTIALAGLPMDLKSPADALAHGIGTVTGDRARSALLTRTIRDNVSITALGRWFGRFGLIRRAVERERVGNALTALSVHGDVERPLTALSGGNQQRALVGRLLAADLGVMVFDDPTVGVDIASRAQLWDQIRMLADGRVIVFASGEAEELMGVCDRVVCIRSGQVSAILEGADITERALALATA